MGSRIPYMILFMILLAPLGIIAVGQGQIQPPVAMEIKGKTTSTIDDKGVATVEMTLEFSTSAFIKFKQAYNPLSTFVRELSPRSMPQQIEELSINLDEANNRLIAKYKVIGAAVYMGAGKWVLHVGDPKSLTLSATNGNTFVFTNAEAVGSGYKIIETITINLPPDAKNPKYDDGEGTITYELPIEGSGPGGVVLRYLGLALAGIGVVTIASTILMSRRLQPSQ